MGFYRSYKDVSKKEILHKLKEEGLQYKKNLSNKSILFIYNNTDTNKVEQLEVEFLSENFQHLTGIDFLDENGNIKRYRSKEFFDRCTQKPYLTEPEMHINNLPNVTRKMDVLPYLSNITKITRMCGKYDKNNVLQDKLKSDYALGSRRMVLGVSIKDNGTYFPRTLLKQDITKLVEITYSIIAIFEKDINSKDIYKKIKFSHKDFDLTKLDLPKEIKDKISLENYIPPKHNKNYLISGAMNKEIIDIRSDKAFKYAVKSYDKIRKNKKDIELIAKNTNLSIDAIKLVKNYLFMDKHMIGNKERRFAPCFEIAKSWYRLAFDKEHITPHDLMLLKHELVEIQYVSMGMNQNIAHRKTLDEGYNYMIEAHKYYFPEKTQNLININKIDNDLNISKEENIDIDDDYEMEY